MLKNSTKMGEFEELVLLAIVATGDESTVVGIQQSLREDAQRRSSLGAIYSALERLETKRLAISRLGEPSGKRGGKRNRYYRLTKNAERALVELKAVRENMWSRSSLGGLRGKA